MAATWGQRHNNFPRLVALNDKWNLQHIILEVANTNIVTIKMHRQMSPCTISFIYLHLWKVHIITTE